MSGNEGNGGPTLRLHDEVGILQLDLEMWRQRASRKDGPLVTEAHWWPGAPDGTVQDVFRVTVPAAKEIGQQELRAAQRARRLLHQLPAILSERTGRRRLEDKPEWRAVMHNIETYLAKPSTTLERAVGHFWDYLVSDLDDDDLDAEAEGEDIEERRKKAALGKLKRWRSLWAKLPESKKTADFT